MVFEIAEIEVKAGDEAAFEANVARAAPLFQAARGYRSFALQRTVERPNVYRLVVGWETVENHMVDFRESPAFQEWRGLVGGFFAGAPKVEHTETVFDAG
jgi:heme-degrading monooxygenase HmoA